VCVCVCVCSVVCGISLVMERLWAQFPVVVTLVLLVFP